MNNSLQFKISPEATSLGVDGCYFVIENMLNASDSKELETLCADTLTRLFAGLSETALENDMVLKGFRELHTRVGCSNRKFVASPENLLNMLLRNKRLPKINMIVDIYNLVSCKSRLAIGAHDIERIVGNVELRLTRGDEVFWPLGADKPTPVRTGEYAYIDDNNEVLCRLEVRQVEKTKVTLGTTKCFYIVQGNPATTSEQIQSVAQELITLTQRFCGGNVRMLYPVK
jgi:DNA/RNA-binding domain of Phe-tRNA-synthetase-like protein